MIICFQCNQPNLDSSKYCEECGTVLQESNEVQSQTTTVRIGRAEDNDIIIPRRHTQVSRYHAKVMICGDQLVMEDLDTANKIYINDHAISEPAQFSLIDRISFGSYEFNLSALAPYLANFPGSLVVPSSSSPTPPEGPAMPPGSKSGEYERNGSFPEDAWDTDEESNEVVLCDNCGKANAEDANFCEVCGVNFYFDNESEWQSEREEYSPNIPLAAEGAVIGKFRLLKVLGSGGMGTVFLAEHIALGKKVALKVLASHLTHNERLMERFEQEARVQANLEHPNIAQVTDFITDNINYAIVIEYVPGMTLSEILEDSGGPMSTEEIKQFMLPVLDAVGYAHVMNVVHRDLKPANIIIKKAHGRIVPKVVDFGIARTVSASSFGRTAASAKLGTCWYMSPEQCKCAAKAGPRSDLYSLGITIYELATGHVPFDYESDMEVMLAHVESPPQPPCHLNPNINKKLEKVILKSLEKDPSDRFRCATEFAAALEKV